MTVKKTLSRESPQVSPDKSILGCENVTKRFGATTAVDDVSFGVSPGEWISIIGPNGAGKTTLLNTLSGFHTPDGDGQIYFQGDDITNTKSYTRARKGLGRTFQGLELFEEEDTIENLMTIQGIQSDYSLLESLLYYLNAKQKEAQNLEKVEDIIDFLELWQYRHKKIAGLPIGIRRRIDLGRALTLNPDVLMLDESMSGLTFDEKYDIARLLNELNVNQGITMIMIEHDLEVVMDVSDRIIVLQNGRVLARGPPEKVVNDAEVSRVYTGV